MDSWSLENGYIYVTTLGLGNLRGKIQEDCQIQNTRKSALKQSLPEMATYTKPKEGKINGDINTKGGNFHGDAILRQKSTGN